MVCAYGECTVRKEGNGVGGNRCIVSDVTAPLDSAPTTKSQEQPRDIDTDSYYVILFLTSREIVTSKEQLGWVDAIRAGNRGRECYSHIHHTAIQIQIFSTISHDRRTPYEQQGFIYTQVASLL